MACYVARVYVKLFKLKEMVDLIKVAEEAFATGKQHPEFKAGDTVKVMYKIVEDKGERLQAYEGVCIARSNNGLNSSFTVRKISFGEGVERVFPVHSPNIEKVELIRSGKVRRGKLYYLRGRVGKAAKVKERKTSK